MNPRKQLATLGMKGNDLDRALAAIQAITRHTTMPSRDATALVYWVWARDKLLAADLVRLWDHGFPQAKSMTHTTRAGRSTFHDFYTYITERSPDESFH